MDENAAGGLTIPQQMGPMLQLTPEKLNYLAGNIDPKPLFSILQSGNIGAGGGGTYSGMMQPGGKQPSPVMTPQMLQMLQPKAPNVLPPPGASLAPQRQMQAPAQFQTARQSPVPSYTSILTGK